MLKLFSLHKATNVKANSKYSDDKVVATKVRIYMKYIESFPSGSPG
jgi:hypothetical protein